MEAIVISSPETVITAVPRIFGFVPENSLVILWISDGSVVLAQRVDLPSCVTEEWAHASIDAARHTDAKACIDVWVCADPPERSSIARLHSALTVRGVDCIATVATDGGTWLCDGASCVPRGLPESLRWRGPGRGDFQVVAQDGPGVIRQAAPVAGEDAIDGAITRLIRSVRQDLPWTRTSSRRAVRALQDPRVRDCLLWHVGADPLLARPLADHLAVLLRRTAVAATGEIAVTCAVAYWVSGDGYRASVVLERALRDAPGHVLGNLFEAALQAGLPPRAWVDRLRETPYDVCRRGRACTPEDALYSLKSG